jgi:hypothetical protein
LILRALCGWALGTLLAQAQTTLPWGLTVTNINNPIAPIIATNTDGSISITAGGGDAYSAPDSFTYAYQTVTGDFDIKVRIIDLTATDPQVQDSPKASLMVRASLDAKASDFMISALPLAPSKRDGQIESIGRLYSGIDTDDLPGRGQNYGGDTTDHGYCTYPDLWLRIQRQGDKFMSYFATTNTTDIPSGSNPGGTNGWQLLVVIPAGTNFSNTVYVGLATVAHNGDITDTTKTVTATYASYGPTGPTPSIPSWNGTAVPDNQKPGTFPNQQVIGVNWDVSLPADGKGYPAGTIQSAQGAATDIVWNDAGFGSVSRDEIASINSESPLGFSAARYQTGAFDFLISPRDPILAQQNLGPYSNPNRERIGSGDPTVPASQAYAPSPNYGFVISTVRQNGALWNDQSPSFYASTYVQLDDVATGAGYDMIGGHFRGGQFYTRTTKLVTGPVAANGPASGKLQRCAIPVSIAFFPYDQGWKAGYFGGANVDQNNPGTPHWKRGDGFGLHSGTAVSGITNQVPEGSGSGQAFYNSPQQLLSWLGVNGQTNGLGFLRLPGVNATNDGMLFTVGNDENNSIRGPQVNNAALPDGSGWYVAVRDLETSKADPTIYATGGGNDAGSSFSFVFIPWNSQNLVGAHVKGTDGSVIKGAGNFTLQRLSTGRYGLSIPGKTGTNGMLMLINSGYLANQPAGYSNVVDTSVLSYEYSPSAGPTNTFVIEARYVDVSGGGEGVATLRDADFNFVWVDFQNPLSPPGSASTTSGQPLDLGQEVNGYQDDFTGETRAAGWAVVGPGGDHYVQRNGVLQVSALHGDPNHLIWEAAGSSNSVQEVLARVRVVNFGVGDPSRAGIGVGIVTNATAANQGGLNLHFRDNTQDGVPGRQVKFLDDGRAWGPAGLRTNVPGQTTPGWTNNTWYWMRLRLAPKEDGTNSLFGKFWVADGVTPEPAKWQMTWADSKLPKPLRTGNAGITASSVDGLGQFEVDYILIKSPNLPKITVDFSPVGPDLIPAEITSVSVPTGNKTAVIDWFGGGTLQSAINPSGPWTNVVNALPPYSAPLTGTKAVLPANFYRLHQ